MKRVIFSLLIPALLFTLPAGAGEIPSLDEQLKNHLHRDYFSVNLLLQSGARFSFHDDNFQGGRTFEAANARISIRGNLDGGFYYRVLYNAVSEPGLLDAFAGYRFSDALSLTFGAMKPDQTLDFLPDPGSTDFVDRTRMTGLLVGSREIGASARGDIGNLYYYAGIYNGNRLNNNNNNRFYGLGRLQYTFEDILPGTIKVAVSGSHGDSQGTRTGSRGPFLRGRRSIAGGDLRIESNGLLFAAEYLRGALETINLPDVKEVISGYYFTGGYGINPNLMILGRWQSWSFREAGTTENQVTLGANINSTGFVSFQANIDAYLPGNGGSMYGASLVFQIKF